MNHFSLTLANTTTHQKYIDDQPSESWGWRKLLAWAIFPMLILVAVFLGYNWLTNGQFGRTAYWTIQQEWFLSLNYYLNTWPATLWLNLTELGDASILFPLLSPMIIWHKKVWVAILGAVPAAAIFSVAGKHLTAIPRPAAVLDYQHFTVIGDLLTSHNSLPSGHSITVVAGIIAVLACIVPDRLNWWHWHVILLGLLVAVVLCLSRVAVGAHWPIDLLIGGACGWIAGLSGASIAHKINNLQWVRSTYTCRWLSLILAGWSLLLVHRAQYDVSLQTLSLWLAVSLGLLTSFYLLGQSSACLFNISGKIQAKKKPKSLVLNE